MRDINRSNKLKIKESSKNFIQISKKRTIVVGIGVIVTFCVIITRIILLNVIQPNQLKKNNLIIHRPVKRADIIDRNGKILATSVETTSLYANPQKLIDIDKTIAQLMSVLPALPEQKLRKNFQLKETTFVWIVRHLTPKQKRKIMKLGIAGIEFLHDSHRIYIHNNLASHILGYTDIDNDGIAGIEKQYNHDLIENKTVQLSIDIRIQHILRSELLQSLEKFHAKGATAIIMDINTREILGIVSVPDYNPNQISNINCDNYFNRAVSGAYEMGSSMKVLNTAMVLDSNLATVNTIFNTGAKFKIGKYSIKDYGRHTKTELSVGEIFTRSSNKGSARMAMLVGPQKQQKFFSKFGCLEPLKIEIPESAKPIYPKKWNETILKSIAYGYGISITPLHLINSVATIVDEGMLKSPTLILNNNQNIMGKKVISVQTSNLMKKLLYLAVSEGTGRYAKVNGYIVGGKTGTRNFFENGGYVTNKVATTFVSTIANDINKPKYVLLVLLELPQGIKETFGFRSAGWNAAPTSAKILSRVATTTGLQPIVQKNTLTLQQLIFEQIKNININNNNNNINN